MIRFLDDDFVHIDPKVLEVATKMDKVEGKRETNDELIDFCVFALGNYVANMEKIRNI